LRRVSDMEWISVEDRLPELEYEVLVWNGTFKKCEIRYRENENYPSESDIKNRYVWNCQGIVNEIEYWMPLPPPP